MQEKVSILSIWTPWRVALLAAIGGIAVGGLTLAGQATLPGSWNHLANSGAVWLVPAFFIAALAHNTKWAALVGVLTLLGEISGYYVSAAIFPKFPPTIFFLALWGGVALVGGPLIGVAGFWWRQKSSWRHIIASAFPGSVFVAEGLYLLLLIQDAPAGWGGVVIGALLTLLLGRSLKERLLALLILPLIVLAGVAAYLIIAWLALAPARS